MKSKEAVRSPLRGLIGGPWLVIGMFLISTIGLLLAVMRRRKLRANPPEVVAEVDYAKLEGVWYEIAHMPGSIQKDFVGTTFTFSPESRGAVFMRTHWFLGTLDGPERESTTLLTAPDPEQPGKLRQRRRVWPLASDFWVLQLGQRYRYAVFGTPDRTRLWIMSREPDIGVKLYQDIVARAELAGFNTERLVDTLQPLEGSEEGSD